MGKIMILGDTMDAKLLLSILGEHEIVSTEQVEYPIQPSSFIHDAEPFVCERKYRRRGQRRFRNEW